MRLAARFATRRALITSGVATLALVLVLFGALIPAVEAACGALPLDLRPHSSAADVRAFLDGCGVEGRAAYQRLQVVDLLYPSASAVFLSGAMWAAASRVWRSPRWTGLWVLPALSSAFDYIENACAWVALARFPASSATDGLLGVASAVKQALGWAGGVALVALLVVLVWRRVASQGRGPRG